MWTAACLGWGPGHPESTPARQYLRQGAAGPIVGRQPRLCFDGAHLLTAAGGHTAGAAGSTGAGREALTA